MLAGWAAAGMPGQQGRTALVTGANSGIGFQAAVELARHGAVVLMACRDAARGAGARAALVRQVPAAAAEVVALDLADLDSVARLAGQVARRDGGLDLLINNAGVMAVPRRQVTAQGFELQFGTNHLGHFALTLRLLPAMMAKPGSRVVTVSSITHRFGSIRLDDLNSERGYGGWRAQMGKRDPASPPDCRSGDPARTFRRAAVTGKAFAAGPARVITPAPGTPLASRYRPAFMIAKEFVPIPGIRSFAIMEISPEC